ncbi:hydrophobic surface binding protein [Mycena leptocephala]|nr:hydrophobic surface binding protein [Mycena leptocephala]
MVQITGSLAIISLAAAGLTRAAVLKRDAATVEADLGVLASQATTLDNAINAFPLAGGSVDSALAIQTDATTLISTVNAATSDAQAAGAFSEADGLAILNGAPSIEPLLDALQGIVLKKPAFEALPISDIDAVILQDLESLQSSLAAFGNALINDFPDDLVAEATHLRDNIVNAFAPAIAAYSS